MNTTVTERPGDGAHQHLTIIRPESGWSMPKFRDAWRRRELLLFFAQRDVKVRYAQTAFGFLWTVVQPIGLTLVFTFAFQKVASIETGSVPYPLFVFSALAFWSFFSRSVLQGADSMASNSALLTKTAAPRLLMPVFPIASALFDFAIMLVLTVGLAGLYGVAPTWRLVLVPVVVVGGALFALGLSLTLSAINVRYRDVRQALPFGIQVLLFLSPIAYPLESLGQPLTTLLAANPLVALIEGMRWCVLATPPPSGVEIGLAACVTAPLLLFGLAYFSRAERVFADVA